MMGGGEWLLWARLLLVSLLLLAVGGVAGVVVVCHGVRWGGVLCCAAVLRLGAARVLSGVV